MLIDRPIHSHTRRYSIPSPACPALTTVQADTFAADRRRTELHVIRPQTRIVSQQHGQTMVFVGNIIFKDNSKIYRCLTSLFLLNLRTRIEKVGVPATVLRPQYHGHHCRPLDCFQFPHMLDNIRQLR
jgi:hypothetical protein